MQTTTNNKKLSDYIREDKSVLVDFYAEWCGPCKVMHPILEQVKEVMKEEVTILKIDVEKNPATATHYQIQGVPTLILFRHGQVKWRQSGVVPALQLEQVIKKYANS